MPASLRPGFGPSLPALARDRFGLSPRTTTVAGVLLLLLLGAAVVLALRLSADEQLVHRGEPVFNLAYDDAALREVDPRPGELARLEGRRPNVSVAITVRPFTVPSYARGDVVGGYLPILAEHRLHELAGLYRDVAVYDEGKSRINGLPGYQIGFGARARDGHPVFGRDAYVFPDDPQATEGVLVSLRRFPRGRQRAVQRDFFDAVKEAYASFAFGESQP